MSRSVLFIYFKLIFIESLININICHDLATEAGMEIQTHIYTEHSSGAVYIISSSNWTP